MYYVESWPTKKIKEVLENNFFCSDIGTDFFEIKEELEQEYFKRLSKQDEKENNKRLKQYEFENERICN
jgi:hypothetical protein